MTASPGMWGSKTAASCSPYRPITLKSHGRLAHSLGDSEPSCLSLRQIIGASTTSPAGFDSLPALRSIAYTAGGIAVVVTIDHELSVVQRFFRARPTAAPVAWPMPSQSAGMFASGPELRKRSIPTLPDIRPIKSSLGGSLNDWEDSPTSRTWTARERVKAASCVSFSADGKFLAVGETGYHPRVLIFSTAVDCVCDTPVAVITEHSYGVSALAFSPDSRYLASLGTPQDGFLHLWSFNAKNGSTKLHSSSKCTSFVHVLRWTSKTSIVTAGTRHVKLWRLEEPKLASPTKNRHPADGRSPTVPASPGAKVLPGRNCILGSLVDRTFTCAATLADDGTILCTDKGDICLVEKSDGNQRVVKRMQLDFSITCVAVEACSKYAWFGGKQGEIRAVSLDEIISSEPSPTSPVTPGITAPESFASQQPSALTGMAALGELLVVVDERHAPRVLSVSSYDNTRQAGPAQLELSTHSCALMGASALDRPADPKTRFFTWSAEGQVLFWDLYGHRIDEMQVELEQLPAATDEFRNELRVVRASPTAEIFVSGDRFGVMRIINGRSRESILNMKAHGAEITDIRIHQSKDMTLVATCSRDRVVQLFREAAGSWTLVQTFEEHKASVSGVLFLKDAAYLLSCSGDRTVAVRMLATKAEAGGPAGVAYLPCRTVTLRSAPVAMTSSCAASQTAADDPGTIFVSTTDRVVQEINVLTGQSLRSFRASDADYSDAVVMDKLLVLGGKETLELAGVPPLLAGVSPTDKSIRVYDQRGSLFCREWGHTEGITGLAVVVEHRNAAAPPRASASSHASTPSSSSSSTFLSAADDVENTAACAVIISTGADGTIMLWDFSLAPPPQNDVAAADAAASGSGNVGGAREMTLTKRPLRKALSRSELAEFRKAAAAAAAAAGTDAAPPLPPLPPAASTPSLPAATPGTGTGSGMGSGTDSMRKKAARLADASSAFTPPKQRNVSTYRRTTAATELRVSSGTSARLRNRSEPLADAEMSPTPQPKQPSPLPRSMRSRRASLSLRLKHSGAAAAGGGPFQEKQQQQPRRTKRAQRSTSPPPPPPSHHKQQPGPLRRSSSSSNSSGNSHSNGGVNGGSSADGGSGDSTLSSATEQLCSALRVFRETLATVSASALDAHLLHQPDDNFKPLQHELELVLEALHSRGITIPLPPPPLPLTSASADVDDGVEGLLSPSTAAVGGNVSASTPAPAAAATAVSAKPKQQQQQQQQAHNINGVVVSGSGGSGGGGGKATRNGQRAPTVAGSGVADATTTSNTNNNGNNREKLHTQHHHHHHHHRHHNHHHANPHSHHRHKREKEKETKAEEEVDEGDDSSNDDDQGDDNEDYLAARDARLVKLLTEHSEKLVGLMDDRLTTSLVAALAAGTGTGSSGAGSNGGGGGGSSSSSGVDNDGGSGGKPFHQSSSSFSVS